MRSLLVIIFLRQIKSFLFKISSYSCECFRNSWLKGNDTGLWVGMKVGTVRISYAPSETVIYKYLWFNPITGRCNDRDYIPIHTP